MSKEHIIDRILPGSIAEELEIEAGDVLVSINGNEIEDVFDYHYMVNDEYLEILIRKADGEEWELEIEKEYNEDLGIEFDNGLMDDYKSCTNKCIFCFIDQMPPGMRETLYFKDDDSSLSFLHGKYEGQGFGSYYSVSFRTNQYFGTDYKSRTSMYDVTQPFCRGFLKEN